MKQIRKGKRLLAVVLSVLLAVSGLSTAAFAEGQATQGLCEHHQEHTAECGYAEEQSCEHERGKHDDTCGYAEVQPCGYVCQEQHDDSSMSDTVTNSLLNQAPVLYNNSVSQYKISISPSNLEFNAATEGYTVGQGEDKVNPWTAHVYNEGTGHETSLFATLDGKNAESFELSNSGSITWEEGSDSYSSIIVSPKAGLSVGQYIATLKVQGTSTPVVTVPVSFTVNASIFVAVTGIKDMPMSMTAGTPLTLPKAVEPETATNKTIVWSLESAGSTGASLNNGILSASSTGTVKVKATVINGATASTPFEKTFDITVNPASPDFVAVTNIKGVPTTMTAGTTLTLAGIVEPANATNQEPIEWSLENAGNTGASLSNGVLSALAAGTVTVKAKIANGTGTGDYEQICLIQVSSRESGNNTGNGGSGGNARPIITPIFVPNLKPGESFELKTTDGKYTIVQNKVPLPLPVFDEKGNLREPIISVGGGNLVVGETKEQPDQDTINKVLDRENSGIISIISVEINSVEEKTKNEIKDPGSEEPQTKSEEQQKETEQQTEQETLSQSVRDLMQQAKDLGANTGITLDFLETKLKDATVKELRDLQSILLKIVTLAGANQAIEKAREQKLEQEQELEQQKRIQELEQELDQELNQKLDQKLNQKLNQKLDQKLDQKLVQKLDQAKEQAMEQVIKVSEKVNQISGPLSEEVSEAVSETVSETGNQVKEQAKEQANQAKEQANQAKEQANQAKEQANQAKEQANQAMEQVIKVSEKVSEKVNQISGPLSETVSEAGNQVKEQVSDLFIEEVREVREVNQVNKAISQANKSINQDKELYTMDIIYSKMLEIGGKKEESEKNSQKSTSLLISNPCIDSESIAVMFHKIYGVWEEEFTVVGDGYVLVMDVDSFSPFALVADPSTLAISDQPTVCTFQPINARVQDGVLQAEASASGVQTAIDLTRKLAEQSGTAFNGVAMTIDLTRQDAASGSALTITKDACKKLEQAGVCQLNVNTQQFSFSLDREALKAVCAAKENVTLRVDKAEGLSEMAKASLGDRPAYQVTAVAGKEIPIFSQGAVTLSLPYVPQGSEQSGRLMLACVGEDGAALPLVGAVHSSEDKTILGRMKQSGVYGIVEVPTPAFNDVDGHWAGDDITFGVSRGYLNGTGSDSFSPDAAMTRGMLATVLHRLAGSPQADEGGLFSDVSGNAYCADAVRWAMEVGILNKEAAALYPEEPVTRQELAVLLQSYARAMELDLPKTREAAAFVDQGGIASWTRDAVREMQMADILNGKDGNRFDPISTVTRAEFVTVLRRFAEVIVKY